MSALVSVIGTIFVDCKGFAKQNYQPDTRNIGSVQFVHGGVGRNVAENLANLDIPTAFVSSVDDSGLGHEVMERLRALSIQADYVQPCPAQGMGMWLAVLDENGNLAGSISQMPVLHALETVMEEKGEEIIARATHVVLELDLNERIARRTLALAKACNRPVYGIPGNLEVIMQHPDLLEGLECFVCNNFEADTCMGIDFTHMDTTEQLAALQAHVQRIGLISMVVTLGEKGSVYYDSRSGQAGYQPVMPVQLIDSTGAGDAFFSGTVAGLVRNLPLEEAVVCGTKVAGWTIEYAGSNCPGLREKMNADPFFQTMFVK
ncbi:carbohydrate kinase family protein [Aneurinibacillus sp. REN35]|uniref:carbohydrate kinase family protein n=1 Tax=Aneurinibacillus sp. REN35 TaxID=3237286 RepID=UPI003527C085